jgi:hypothetical protein
MKPTTHVVETPQEIDVTISCDRPCKFKYWCESEPQSGSMSGFSQWSTEPLILKIETFPHVVSLPHAGRWMFEWEVTEGDRPVFVVPKDLSEKGD